VSCLSGCLLPPFPLLIFSDARYLNIVCDFNIQGTATKLANASCDFPCGGDANLTCGGADAISVYQNHNANVGPLPTNKPNVGSFSFVGCVT
jgi:hypothetical protein